MTTQELHYEALIGRTVLAHRESNIASGSPITEVCERSHHLSAAVDRAVSTSPIRRAPERVRRVTTAGTRPVPTSADRVLRTPGAGTAPGRRGALATYAVGGGCAHPYPSPVRDDVPTAVLVASGLALAIILFMIFALSGGPVYS